MGARAKAKLSPYGVQRALWCGTLKLTGNLQLSCHRDEYVDSSSTPSLVKQLSRTYRTKSSPDLYRNPPSRDSRTREPSWRSCRVERQERGIACLSACEDEKERGLARALQRDGEGNDVRSINYPIRKHSTLEPRTSVPVSPCSHAQLMTLPLARGSWPRNGYECAREGDERGK